MIIIKATKKYLVSLTKIEDFIFESTDDIKALEEFYKEHDRIIQFIEQNPTTPGQHPKSGDQSWPFGSGRYRLFFKFLKFNNSKRIYLLDVIDNRMLNETIDNQNSFPVYFIEEE